MRFEFYLLDRSTIEENDSLQFLVVEEIIEAPQAARLTEWIRIQVRIVAVNVTIVQLDLIVNCSPQRIF
jgi:hypothetical protein